MTCTPAPSAPTRSPRSAFSNLVRAAVARIAAAYGRVTRAAPPPSFAGLLLSRRDTLAAEIRKARRQHRRVKAIYSEARALTHGILARGVEWTR